MSEHEGSEEGGEGLSEVIRAVTDLWDEPLDEVHDVPQIANAILAAGYVPADRLAAVQAEVERLKDINRELVDTHNSNLIQRVRLDERLTTAESARDTALREKADLEARLAAVEAVAGGWERDDEDSLNRFGQHLMGGSVLTCAEHLRAALANPVHPTTAAACPMCGACRCPAGYAGGIHVHPAALTTDEAEVPR